jgi:hypothetical protein
MGRDLKKEALEQFSKKLSSGDFSTGNLISPEGQLGRQAFSARDIAEQALANEFLKDTGLPIPDKFQTTSQAEDFLSRSLKQVYPEFEPNLRLVSAKDAPHLVKSLGSYSPSSASILLNRDQFSPKDIRNLLATAFHEGAHKYDDKVLNYSVPKELMKERGQLDFKKAYDVAKELDRPIDPTEMYEVAAKGHHARIPKLRDADSFGLGALKSYLKSGTFKGLAPLLAKGAMIGAGGLVSAAASAADMPDVGKPSEEDAAIENPQANPELRKAALQKLMGN